LSAEVVPGIVEESSKPATMLAAVSVSPYYTVGFKDFDGKGKDGAGLDVGLNLSKTVAVVAFAESDDVSGTFIDRIGGGLQLSGKLGKFLKPFGRLSGGWTSDTFFVRPQFGASIDLWRKGNWHAAITGSWGLDVDTDGNAAQRIFGGLTVGTSF
jgi:hypothetical protein